MGVSDECGAMGEVVAVDQDVVRATRFQWLPIDQQERIGAIRAAIEIRLQGGGVGRGPAGAAALHGRRERAAIDACNHQRRGEAAFETEL